MTEIKGPLQEHLRLHATTVTKYHDIKDIIVNYFRIKTHYYKNEQTPTPMDIGAYWRKGKGKSVNKGGKTKGKGKFGSKGKGKGKGQFNGYNNFKGKGPKGKTKGGFPDSRGKKGKGKGNGKPWCTNCQSQTHWTSKCWNGNAMQVGSVDEDEATWPYDEDEWHDSVWHLDEWNSSEWNYDDYEPSYDDYYDDGWIEEDWHGPTTSGAIASSSTPMLALPPSTTAASSAVSPFAERAPRNTVGAVVQPTETSSSSTRPTGTSVREYVVTIATTTGAVLSVADPDFTRNTRIMFDTGATIHVCPLWFASSVTMEPDEKSTSLVGIDGQRNLRI
jgi:hypothetical protein